MRVDEFFNRAKSEAAFREKSRVLVIRNRQEQTELRKLFGIVAKLGMESLSDVSGIGVSPS